MHTKGDRLKIGSIVCYDIKKDKYIKHSSFMCFLRKEYEVVNLFGGELNTEVCMYKVIGIK